MKYPQQQFELLNKAINELSKQFEVKNIHPSQLHYIVYQQASEGQLHNALFVNDKGEIHKGYAIPDNEKENYKKLITFLNEDNFKLYPDGCNDNHIETAVKTIQKQLQ